MELKSCCYTCGNNGFNKKEVYCRVRSLKMSVSSSTNMVCTDSRYEQADDFMIEKMPLFNEVKDKLYEK